jgi:cytochrome c oxidase cbb3-type subunit 4
MDIGIFHSIWTVMILVVFISIVAWAYSGKRKERFDEAARLPLEDDDLITFGGHTEEKNHG